MSLKLAVGFAVHFPRFIADVEVSRQIPVLTTSMKKDIHELDHIDTELFEYHYDDV